MQRLKAYLKSKDVTFIHNKITSFADIKTNHIINCTGLGAASLTKGDYMTPVQGHLIMLKKQQHTTINYTLSIEVNKGKTNSGQKIKRSVYFHPKHLPNSNAHDIGVLGGTFIEHATHQTPNNSEFDLIISNAKKFYGLND
ncbi:MAG: FAD-dependent oxidoreductase, partial [Pseudomonadota bacterium]